MDWDEACLRDKLSTIENPPVKDLLAKLLARDPLKRPKSMQEVLADDFFVDRPATHGQIKDIKASLDRVEANTAQIIKMSEVIMKKIENSTSKLCTAIFEATEVSTPSCFVILPYKIPCPDEAPEKGKEKEMLDKAEEWISTVTDLTEAGTGLIESPSSFAAAFTNSSFFKGKIDSIKSKYVEKSLYLYLIDEYSGKPVYDESGVYPIKIDVASDLMNKYMPMMRIGLQAMSVANGVAGVANIFCPFVPRKLVPESLLGKASKFVNDMSSQGIPSGCNSGGNSEAKRGGELREFEKYLGKHDPERLYAGLMRVCEEENGHAIWVSEDSAKTMELQGCDENYLAMEEAIAKNTKDMEKKDKEMAKKDKEILKKEEQIAKLLGQLNLVSQNNIPSAASRAPPEPPGDVQKLQAEMEEARRESDDLRRKLRVADSRALAKSKLSLSSMASGSFSGSFSHEERGLSAASSLKLEMSIKRGELLKKSKYLGKWQLRSITLTSDGKFSWLGGGSKHCGHVILTVNTLASVEEPDGERWPFTLITEARKILFATKTMEERDEWCEAITTFCSS